MSRHLIAPAELLDVEPPYCAEYGPVGHRCNREPEHEPPCAALSTGPGGVPLIVTWYRPDLAAWPLGAGPAPRQCGEPRQNEASE